MSGLRNRISASQWTAWVLTAAIGPILSMSGRGGWMSIAALFLVCAVMCLLLMKCGTGPIPKWRAGLEYVWLVLLIGGIAKQSGTCWSDAQTDWIIPSLLLVLAGFATLRGAEQSARVSSTLIWMILPILGIVSLAGIADAEGSWARRTMEMPEDALAVLLLLPCIVIFVPDCEKMVGKKIIPLLGIVAIGGSFLLDATLGAQAAQEAGNGFYEFCKSVSLFGVAERFEALVACALTSSWFALFTLLLSAAYSLGEKFLPSYSQWLHWSCVAGSVAGMCILHIPTQWLAVGTLVFWGFLPILTQGLGGEKKIVKSKK